MRTSFIMILGALVLGWHPLEAEELPVLTNSVGMKLIRVPAGQFVMGSDRRFDNEANSDEMPAHNVTISKPFCLGKYEVSQAEWTAVMGNNPSEFKGQTLPVQEVSWNLIQEFLKKINAKENTSDYRLPTEAEWEYAVRAGSKTIHHWGDSGKALGDYAWYGDDSGRTGGRPHPVGSLKPNAWGFHDMMGNVWEWVADRYQSDYYAKSPETDPQGPPDGPPLRVLRGGGWHDDPEHMRSAIRFYFSQSGRNNSLGFRLAKNCP
ncbi:MAG: formylglycine-generating enzyme family protein [Magnetococcus sp. YQC-3]